MTERVEAAAAAPALTAVDGNGHRIDASEIELTDSRLYVNRELSWLDFNDRVLQLAEDESLPLLERVKFLAIFVTNLDEFFMVRVAGVHDQVDARIDARGPDGLSPTETLEIRAGTEAGTLRTPSQESIVFGTVGSFVIPPLVPAAYLVQRAALLGSSTVAISGDGRFVTSVDGAAPCLWSRDPSGRWAQEVEGRTRPEALA